MNEMQDEFLSSIFKVIHKSIDDNKKESSPIIKYTYLRLLDQNIEKSKAIDAIASVLIAEMCFALKFDEYGLFKESFKKNLNNLPKLPLLN